MKSSKLTDLEKRLIALGAFGFWIEFNSGHRYLRNVNEDDLDGETYNGYEFFDCLKEKEILLNTKMYGGVIEVLDIIDIVLLKMHGHNLIQFYNDEITNSDIYSKSRNPMSRITFRNQQP